MKLIIDISKEVYKNIQKRSAEIQAEGFSLENSVLNGTPIPEDATNGDVIKAMFPNAKIIKMFGFKLFQYYKNVRFDDAWWNTPYKGEKI